MLFRSHLLLQVMYGQMEEAETLIEDLCRDKVSQINIKDVLYTYMLAPSNLQSLPLLFHFIPPALSPSFLLFLLSPSSFLSFLSLPLSLQDPLLRRSGMFTVAMAYCGSGDNKAIRRLLHVAVSWGAKCFRGSYRISQREFYA